MDSLPGLSADLLHSSNLLYRWQCSFRFHWTEIIWITHQNSWSRWIKEDPKRYVLFPKLVAKQRAKPRASLFSSGLLYQDKALTLLVGKVGILSACKWNYRPCSYRATAGRDALLHIQPGLIGTSQEKRSQG